MQARTASARSSGKVALHGTELGYLVEGTGTPCLAVGSTVFWPPTFSQELRKHLKLIFADTRFIRPPQEPSEHEDLTLDILLDDIDQVRRGAGLDRAVVLGHSALGILALEYARKYPQHASHVVMIGTPPYPLVEFDGPNIDFVAEAKDFWEADASDERKAILKRNQANLTEERLSQTPPGKAFGVWYLAHAPMVWFDPTYDASWLFNPIEFDSPTFNHFLSVILKDYDIGKTLRQVEAPIFLALGRYDYLVPHILWDKPRDGVANLASHLFERSGHYPMMEQSELFDSKLRAWLGSTDI